MKRAYFADVLIFAAASNGGGNKGRAYPVRDKHVFCIHSTDALGNRSIFSPTPERNAYNFATVGEAVQSFWPKHLCNPDEAAVKTKSGTSFATPIAASIAAFLLLYARVNLATEPEIAKGLKGYQAMESLLFEVCQSSRPKTDRDGYQYLFLSRYPDSFFGEDRNGEEINNRFRRCI
jgi:subtilisin family serine protease